MESQPSRPKGWRVVFEGISTFIMFLLFSALSIWIMLRLRSNFIQIIVFFNISKYTFKGAANLGTVIIGFLAVLGIVWIQDYLFKGLKQGTLWRRAGIVLLIEGSFVLFSLGLTLVMRYFAF